MILLRVTRNSYLKSWMIVGDNGSVWRMMRRRPAQMDTPRAQYKIATRVLAGVVDHHQMRQPNRLFWQLGVIVVGKYIGIARDKWRIAQQA